MKGNAKVLKDIEEAVARVPGWRLLSDSDIDRIVKSQGVRRTVRSKATKKGSS